MSLSKSQCDYRIYCFLWGCNDSTFNQNWQVYYRIQGQFKCWYKTKRLVGYLPLPPSGHGVSAWWHVKGKRKIDSWRSSDKIRVTIDLNKLEHLIFLKSQIEKTKTLSEFFIMKQPEPILFLHPILRPTPRVRPAFACIVMGNVFSLRTSNRLQLLEKGQFWLSQTLRCKCWGAYCRTVSLTRSLWTCSLVKFWVLKIAQKSDHSGPGKLTR